MSTKLSTELTTFTKGMKISELAETFKTTTPKMVQALKSLEAAGTGINLIDQVPPDSGPFSGNSYLVEGASVDSAQLSDILQEKSSASSRLGSSGLLSGSFSTPESNFYQNLEKNGGKRLRQTNVTGELNMSRKLTVGQTIGVRTDLVLPSAALPSTINPRKIVDIIQYQDGTVDIVLTDNLVITTGDTKNGHIPNKVYLSTNAISYWQEGDEVEFYLNVKNNQSTLPTSGYITKVDKGNITIDYLDASGTNQTITYNKADYDFWDHQIRVIGS